MRKEERLFAALSDVDDELLERSERRRGGKSRWAAWGAALAACLAVVLAVGHGMAVKKENPPPPGLEDDHSAEQPTVPDEETCVSPAYPDEPQKLRWLQIAPQGQGIPEFTFWVNEESYYTFEQNGVYTVKPYDPPQVPGEELPECKFEVEYLACSMEDALETVWERLESLYTSVAYGSDTEDRIEHYFRADNGTDWNAAQREVWLLPYEKPNEEEGVFVLSSSYFLEAEEGHGVRFRDMAATFRVWRTAEIFPYSWMEDMKWISLRLTKAVMSNDLSYAEDLLAPDAEVIGPEENLYAYISISNISYDYNIRSAYKGHEEDEPESANVSVQFRLGGEDSYSYLTMKMIYQDGRWLAEWIGIEK